MGIGGGAKKFLLQLPEGGIPNCGVERVPLSKFKGKRIIIDWSNIAYRFLNRSNSLAQFLNEFINIIHKFAREGIEPIFVFDGKPNNAKQHTIDHRKNAREKVFDKICGIIENANDPEKDFETIMHLSKRVKSIHLLHVVKCKQIFESLGIHYIHLENIEADNIFKLALENGIADVCFSGDMDLMSFGCNKIILDLNFKEDTVVEIDYEILINHLEVSHKQLQMAFILSGTDWNNGLKKSNFAKNIELIRKYGDIPSIMENLEEINKDFPEDSHIKLPNRFNWQFSVSIYSEILDSGTIIKIQEILKKQKQHFEIMQSPEGFDILLEYGKTILKNDPDFKYIRKYQEYIFWKYSYRMNLIPSISIRFKQKPMQYPDFKQTLKKVRN